MRNRDRPKWSEVLVIAPFWNKGLQKLAQVAARTGFLQSELLRFVIGTNVRSEQDIHERRDVAVVAGVAVAVVVPVMQLRSAGEDSQRPGRDADVGMNIDGPDAAEGDEASQCFYRKAEDECGQVDEADGVDRSEEHTSELQS